MTDTNAKDGLPPSSLWKKLLKGLISIEVVCVIIGFLLSMLETSFPFPLSMLSTIRVGLFDGAILALLGIVTLVILKLMVRRQWMGYYVLFGIWMFFVVSVVGGVIAGVEPGAVFAMVGELFVWIYRSIATIIPFLIALPFILLIYYTRLRRTAPYNLSNLKFYGSHLLVGDGHHFKIFNMLEIKNIPKNILVKEGQQGGDQDYFGRRSDLQYFHSHLTALVTIIPQLTYEIRILRNKVKIRFCLSLEGSQVNALVGEMEALRETVITVFQSTFPGLKVYVLEGTTLQDAWGCIFGGWGQYKYKIQDQVLVDRVIDKTYLAILRIEGAPRVKFLNKRSQLDSLIRGALGTQLDLNFIISAVPQDVRDFEGQIRSLEQYADRIHPKIFNTNKGRSQNRVINTNYTFRDELAAQKVQKQIGKMRHAEATGVWNVSGYLVLKAREPDILDRDIQKVSGLLTSIYGIQTIPLQGRHLKRGFAAIPFRSPLSKPEELSSEQLAIFLHLPEDPIPSISRTDIPEFEVPPELRVRGGIELGKVMFYDHEMHSFQLTPDDLRLNTFISGLIGSGKTRLAMNILRQLSTTHPHINWIVLDWKGEYQYMAQDFHSHNVRILVPGSEASPVQLNMFDPLQTNTDEHARKLFAIIREVFKNEFNRSADLSAQMESVCKEVLREVIRDPQKRSLDAFLEELQEYGRTNQSYNRTVPMTVSALLNRFDKFKHGVLATIFDVKRSNVDFEALMEQKVIVNLNPILTKGGAKEDVRLLMNLILKYVIDKALTRGVTSSLKHVVIIEDSQFLIPAVMREVPETALVEDIPLLLRGVGESLITVATRPEISADIIANSGVKISFKSPYDAQKIAKYLNLNAQQEEYLKVMPAREAIVSLPSFPAPFRIHTAHYEYERPDPLPLNHAVSHDNFPAITEEAFMEKQSHHSPKQDRLSQIEEARPQDRKSEVRQEAPVPMKPIPLPTAPRESVPVSSKSSPPLKRSTPPIPFEQVQSVLLQGPINKLQLSRQLGVPKPDLTDSIRPYLEDGRVKTQIAPVFENRDVKQRLYFLPEFDGCVIAHIKNRLSEDFRSSGKIGAMDESNIFDYVWYGTNAFLKVLVYERDQFPLDQFQREILEWMEKAMDRKSYELILIVPFAEWAEQIRGWLRSHEIKMVLVFGFFTADWAKLHEYLYDGIVPTWDNLRADLVQSLR